MKSTFTLCVQMINLLVLSLTNDWFYIKMKTWSLIVMIINLQFKNHIYCLKFTFTLCFLMIYLLFQMKMWSLFSWLHIYSFKITFIIQNTHLLSIPKWLIYSSVIINFMITHLQFEIHIYYSKHTFTFFPNWLIYLTKWKCHH